MLAFSFLLTQKSHIELSDIMHRTKRNDMRRMIIIKIIIISITLPAEKTTKCTKNKTENQFQCWPRVQVFKWQKMTKNDEWWRNSSKNRKVWCQPRTTYWFLGPRSDMLAVKTSDLSLNFCDFWSLRAIQDTFN